MVHSAATPTTRRPATARPRLFLSDVVLIGLGLSTTLLTALALAYVALAFGFAVYSVLWWGVIPAGAFACGTLAAAGYALGAKVIGRRPGRLVTVAVVIGGPLTYGLIFLFQYALLDVNGRPVQDQWSLLSFVDAAVRGTSLRYRMSGESPPLGVAGYAVAALNLAGFFFGSLFILGAPWFRRIACEQCARYMPEPTSVLAHGAREMLNVRFTYARNLLIGGEVRAAVDAVASLPEADANHRLTLDVTSCEACRRDYHHLQLLQWDTHASPPWIPVKGFDEEGQIPRPESELPPLGAERPVRG